MSPDQHRKLQKTVEHYNKQYKKDHSSVRAYLTDDPANPIAIVDLASNTFPDRRLLAKLTAIDILNKSK